MFGGDPEAAYEDSCFDAQQAAEKSLKGMLVHLAIPFPKTHSVADLITLVAQAGTPVRLNSSPDRAIGKTIIVSRFRLDGNAVARLKRRHVARVSNDDGMNEMLVEVVDVFRDAVLHAGRDSDVIEHGKMLDVFAEANAASVWADGHPELGSHQDDGE